MKKLLIALGAIIVIIILVVIFKKDSQDESENFAIGQAEVSSVSAVLQETFPVQVQVIVSGNLPDACTELGDVIQTKDPMSNDFMVTLETKRPLDAVCAEVLSAFDTTFTLDGTTGLPQGDYKVIVNGVEGDFYFQVDNYVSDLDTLK